MTGDKEQTYSQWRLAAQRRIDRNLFFGIGTAGLGLYGAGALGATFFHGRAVLAALFATMVGLAVALLAASYHYFETVRNVADGAVVAGRGGDKTSPEDRRNLLTKEKRGMVYSGLAIGLLLAAGVTLLAAAWANVVWP